MRITLLISLGLITLGPTECLAKSPPCNLITVAYQTTVIQKIKAGVPFELMAVAADGDSLLCRQTVQISYDLWDEIVTFSRNEAILGRSPLKTSDVFLCKHLLCEPTPVPTHNYRLRILLNPLWEGRVARLQSNTNSNSTGLVTINWQRLKSDLASEKILVDTEVVP